MHTYTVYHPSDQMRCFNFRDKRNIVLAASAKPISGTLRDTDSTEKPNLQFNIWLLLGDAEKQGDNNDFKGINSTAERPKTQAIGSHLSYKQLSKDVRNSHTTVGNHCLHWTTWTNANISNTSKRSSKREQEKWAPNIPPILPIRRQDKGYLSNCSNESCSPF